MALRVTVHHLLVLCWVVIYLILSTAYPLLLSQQPIWIQLVMMLSRACDSPGHAVHWRHVTPEPSSLEGWDNVDIVWSTEGRTARRARAEEESETNIYAVALLTLHDFKLVGRKAMLDRCTVPECIQWQLVLCIFDDVLHWCSGNVPLVTCKRCTCWEHLMPQLTCWDHGSLCCSVSSLLPCTPFSVSTPLFPILKLHHRKIHGLQDIFLQSAYWITGRWT